jgi:serine/threonine-protein kinase
MDGSLPAGTIFANKYEILSLAGSGGMGTVYKAKQIDLERIVALKLLDPGLVADSESQQRFIREAQSINQLSNEHIATFFA